MIISRDFQALDGADDVDDSAANQMQLGSLGQVSELGGAGEAGEAGAGSEPSHMGNISSNQPSEAFMREIGWLSHVNAAFAKEGVGQAKPEKAGEMQGQSLAGSLQGQATLSLSQRVALEREAKHNNNNPLGVSSGNNPNKEQNKKLRGAGNGNNSYSNAKGHMETGNGPRVDGNHKSSHAAAPTRLVNPNAPVFTPYNYQNAPVVRSNRFIVCELSRARADAIYLHSFTSPLLFLSRSPFQERIKRC